MGSGGKRVRIATCRPLARSSRTICRMKSCLAGVADSVAVAAGEVPETAAVGCSGGTVAGGWGTTTDQGKAGGSVAEGPDRVSAHALGLR